MVHGVVLDPGGIVPGCPFETRLQQTRELIDFAKAHVVVQAIVTGNAELFQNVDFAIVVVLPHVRLLHQATRPRRRLPTENRHDRPRNGLDDASRLVLRARNEVVRRRDAHGFRDRQTLVQPVGQAKRGVDEARLKNRRVECRRREKRALTDSIGGGVQLVPVFGLVHQQIVDVLRHCVADRMNVREKELSFVVVIDLQHQIDSFLQLVDALLVETNPSRVDTVVRQIQITIIVPGLTLSRGLVHQGVIQLNLSRRKIAENHLLAALSRQRAIFVLRQATDRRGRRRAGLILFRSG